MTHNLYAGVSGTALFLAAVYRITQDPQWKELGLAALGTVSGLATVGTLGGASGTPSTAYAVLVCAQLLEETAWLDEAVRIAKLIAPQQIDQDEAYDVVSGTAGSILGLLAVYQATGDRELLDLSIRCGERLLAMRGTEGAWPTYEGKALCGLTHGAAGIAMALERLHRTTGDTRYRQAALDAIAYENSLFHPTHGSWPDLRRDDVCAGSWCHGAPGVGLARLDFVAVLPQASHDLEAAIAHLRQAKSTGVDHICCGDLGRAELLLATGHAGEARRTASHIVNAARHRGHYRLNWNEQYFWSSFHQGMAGIGYQLLRTAYPAQLPAVLAWGTQTPAFLH